MLDFLFPLFNQCASRTKNRTIPHNSSESPALVVFLSLISYNQFCPQSEYQMKLYESNHLVATVPMNKKFSPDERWQSLLLPAGLSSKMLFNAKGRCNDKSNSFHTHSYGCVMSPVDQFFVFSHLPKKIEPIN